MDLETETGPWLEDAVGRFRLGLDTLQERRPVYSVPKKSKWGFRFSLNAGRDMSGILGGLEQQVVTLEKPNGT